MDVFGGRLHDVDKVDSVVALDAWPDNFVALPNVMQRSWRNVAVAVVDPGQRIAEAANVDNLNMVEVVAVAVAVVLAIVVVAVVGLIVYDNS